MADLWTELSGSNLGTIEEEITTEIVLPLVNNTSTVHRISGELPPGLRIVNNTLKGTPRQVARTTDFTFVLRALYENEFEDRTYTVTVQGPDAPVWQTPAGDLEIGPNGLTFILDSSIIDFQLEAVDDDLPAGDTVEYYIKNGNGELPPGTLLTTDGRIVGVIDPLLALDRAASTGYYDTNLYDKYPYDFGALSNNGFDSFFYDTTPYDTSIPTQSPKKLNRYYEFIVTATDGDTEVDRRFKIFVVGDDFLRADNTIMKAGTGVFTADGTYVRQLFWLTPENLGFRRANNYVTLFLETYDPVNILGITSYRLVSGTLPPGLELDTKTGEIAGRVPYQSKVTQSYEFTVEALRQYGDIDDISRNTKTFRVTMLGEVDSVITWNTNSDLGDIRANLVSNLNVEAETTVPNVEIVYTLKTGKLPNGLFLTPKGEIIGKPRQYNSDTEKGLTFIDSNDFLLDGGETTLDREFEFTIEARDKFNYSASEKTFKVKVDDPTEKLYSNIYFEPAMKQVQRNLFRNFISNPSVFDPSLIYRASDPNFGIQTQPKMLVFAGIETVAINSYIAAIAQNHKRKRYRFGDIKTAVAREPGTRDTVYEVVYVEIIDPKDAKVGKTKRNFSIETKNRITADSIQYHVKEDSTPFGKGFTTLTIDGRNTDSDILIDDVILTIYQRTGSFEIPIEDDLFIDIRNQLEDLEIDLEFADSEPFRFRPQPQSNTSKADSTGFKINDGKDSVKYLSNTQNMRDRIKNVGDYEKEFLPLWMKSSQPNRIQELGYVKAVPLCYCKPGTSDTVVQNINNYIQETGFDFKKLEFDVDRYVIDSTEGNSDKQYLIFPNYQFNI